MGNGDVGMGIGHSDVHRPLAYAGGGGLSALFVLRLVAYHLPFTTKKLTT